MEQILSGNWGLILVILLRLISIVIPIIPGTYCLLISGYLFGLINGLLISLSSDLIACSLSFYLSREYGRAILRRIMSKKYLNKFELISKNYLERNFFLLTGFLMTGWFDFVSYGVGLTKLKWKTFFSALFISAFLSDLPFVATGNGLKELKKQNFSLREIIEGDIPSLQGNFLIIFIVSVTLIFTIGILGTFIKRKYIKE